MTLERPEMSASHTEDKHNSQEHLGMTEAMQEKARAAYLRMLNLDDSESLSVLAARGMPIEPLGEAPDKSFI